MRINMTNKNSIETISKSRKLRANKSIVISGPPAAGKSVVGREVAERINIPFHDIDNLISKRAGVRTLKELTRKYGRKRLYEIEPLCLKEVFQKSEFILALNGGVNCRSGYPALVKKNRELIKKNAFNVCLMPSPDLNEATEILWPRQEDNKRSTPYNNPKGLHLYLKERMPRYISEADRVIFTYLAPVEKVVDAVLESLRDD